MFALGHIYTHMTFGLFTNIASRARGKHIYKYVPASGEYSHRVSVIRPMPGTPRPVCAGYTSSGSVTGYPSSGSVTGYPSSGSVTGSPSSGSLWACRHLHPDYAGLAGLVHSVLTGSSLPAPDIPSGGTVILTNSPFTSAWDVSPVRSSSGTLPACRV